MVGFATDCAIAFGQSLEKTRKGKGKNLIRLGVDQDHAYAWSRTRKGGWAIAQSPILGTTITLQRLKKRGYVSLTELHLQLNPSLCEPPSTWPVRSVVWEAHSVSYWRSRLLDYAVGFHFLFFLVNLSSKVTKFAVKQFQFFELCISADLGLLSKW